MYISILDYSRQTVTIIRDTESVTRNMQTEQVETLLYYLGFHGSEISFMLTEKNPYSPVTDYVTIKELCEDIDEQTVETLQEILNIQSEE